MAIDLTEKTTDFSHPELNQQITAIGGSYLFIKEERLPINGEEVLYLLGNAIFDSSCCGFGGCAYAMVPGVIRSYRYSTDDAGRPVSQVAAITDPQLQERVKALIRQKHLVHQVNFL
ncbi:MAG TPA: hypothetical protein VKN73_08310 [Desulfosalsimonadaceae bacterium]|nr:hypothetical protein [Desulfosalsimonadaceae bacterium]